MVARMLRCLAAAPLLAFASACSDSSSLPEPVVFTPASGTPVRVHDATFDPLPNADAHYGDLHGAKYRIEIPHEWNGSLVMYMRGSEEHPRYFEIHAPIHRRWLISNGYAWAASSYDRQDYITGAAADQTAALWDYFAREFGRPARTYAIGDSMGGAAALISAERYADRYAGAMSACGVSGARSLWDMFADFMAAAVFASGMTPNEVFSRPPSESIYEHIMPRIAADPERRKLFEDTWISLSGGERPFGRVGFEMSEPDLWAYARHRTGLYSNSDRTYTLDDWVGIDSGEFNEAAIRFPVWEAREEIPLTEEITGELQIPVMILHTTGDGLVPLSQVHYVEDKVAEAGRLDLLEVRLIPQPAHCGFTRMEYASAFRSLVEAVEAGGWAAD